MVTEPPCDCVDCFAVRMFGLTDRTGHGSSGPKRLFTHFPKVHQHRGHAEQLGRYGSPGSKKYEKRRANRLRRRAERHDPENAPSRLIRGWND